MPTCEGARNIYNQIARVKALEKSAARPLPLFCIEYGDGTTHTADALDVFLMNIEAEAGATDTSGIKGITRTNGNYPTGTAWEELKTIERSKTQ